MAEIRPFCALHPTKERAAEVAALPYDVYNREEARAEVDKNPGSFLAIDRPETQFPEEQDMYAPEVYQKAAQMLQDWEDRGIFVQEKKPVYYIWELTMDGRAQTGLVACSSVDDYLNGVILRHENTRKEKEADRTRHVSVTSAQTGPIFLAYRDNPEVSRSVEEARQGEPWLDFTAEDGVRHRVWKVDKAEQIRNLTDAFARLPHTYIADGHHRAASAVSVSLERRKEHPDYTGSEEFNSFLSVLFPDSQLKILDYNRVLKDLSGNTPEELLKKLKEKFLVEEIGAEPFRPRKKGEMGLFLDSRWYRLEVLPELVQSDPIGILDVSYLQREVLQPIWNITDPRTNDRIDFVGGIRGLKELERRCCTDCAAAFAMYPTSIGELFAAADAGLLMPPKSTWFEPKLRSGLFIHKIEA